MKLRNFTFIVSLSTVFAASPDWSKIRAVYPSQTQSLGSRIVGGTIATRGQIPYQAGVISDGSTFCAGALVSDNIVLTAAHCIDRRSSYEVHLGADYIFNNNEPGHVIMTSSDGVKYPEFNGTINFTSDLAFIRLATPVEMSDYIAVVNIPSLSQVDESFAGETARTSGWGHIDDLIPSLSQQLRFADVIVTSLEECQADYGSEVVTPCSICVGTQLGTVGICSGDAGAPLVYIDETSGDQTLIGIASFGHPFGCEKKEANVYVRMTCYIEWLQDEAGVTVRP